MTIRHLEIFLRVAESESMSTAAKELFISQPTVSGSIAELEKEYNVRLFERLNKRLYITEAGEKLRIYARKMLNLRNEIQRQMSSAEDTTPVRIGATVTIGTSLLPEYISRIKETNILVRIDNTQNIRQGILNNTLDMGLVEGRITDEDVKAIPFMKDELMMICRKDYKHAGKKTIGLSEICGEPMILREENSGTRMVIDEAYEQAGIKLNVLWNCNNTQTILNAVEAGIGISILSPKLLKGYTELTAVPIKDSCIERDFQLVLHKDKYIGRKMHKIINLITNETI